jgi:hypothetical protein
MWTSRFGTILPCRHIKQRLRRRQDHEISLAQTLVHSVGHYEIGHTGGRVVTCEPTPGTRMLSAARSSDASPSPPRLRRSVPSFAGDRSFRDLGAIASAAGSDQNGARRREGTLQRGRQMLVAAAAHITADDVVLDHRIAEPGSTEPRSGSTDPTQLCGPGEQVGGTMP